MAEHSLQQRDHPSSTSLPPRRPSPKKGRLGQHYEMRPVKNSPIRKEPAQERRPQQPQEGDARRRSGKSQARKRQHRQAHHELPPACAPSTKESVEKFIERMHCRTKRQNLQSRVNQLMVESDMQCRKQAASCGNESPTPEGDDDLFFRETSQISPTSGINTITTATTHESTSNHEKDESSVSSDLRFRSKGMRYPQAMNIMDPPHEGQRSSRSNSNSSSNLYLNPLLTDDGTELDMDRIEEFSQSASQVPSGNRKHVRQISQQHQPGNHNDLTANGEDDRLSPSLYQMAELGDDNKTLLNLRLQLFCKDDDDQMVPKARLTRALGELVMQDDIIENLQLDLEDAKETMMQMADELQALRESQSVQTMKLEYLRTKGEQERMDHGGLKTKHATLQLELHRSKAQTRHMTATSMKESRKYQEQETSLRKQVSMLKKRLHAPDDLDLGDASTILEDMSNDDDMYKEGGSPVTTEVTAASTSAVSLDIGEETEILALRRQVEDLTSKLQISEASQDSRISHPDDESNDAKVYSHNTAERIQELEEEVQQLKNDLSDANMMDTSSAKMQDDRSDFDNQITKMMTNWDTFTTENAAAQTAAEDAYRQEIKALKKELEHGKQMEDEMHVEVKDLKGCLDLSENMGKETEKRHLQSCREASQTETTLRNEVLMLKTQMLLNSCSSNGTGSSSNSPLSSTSRSRKSFDHGKTTIESEVEYTPPISVLNQDPKELEDNSYLQANPGNDDFDHNNDIDDDVDDDDGEKKSESDDGDDLIEEKSHLSNDFLARLEELSRFDEDEDEVNDISAFNASEVNESAALNSSEITDITAF
eukprot:scaffold19910_cov51-Attheya_sp.AAC.4